MVALALTMLERRHLLTETPARAHDIAWRPKNPAGGPSEG